MPDTGDITNFPKLEIYELKEESTTSTTTFLDLRNSLLDSISYFSLSLWKLICAAKEALHRKPQLDQIQVHSFPICETRFKSITLNSQEAFQDHDSEAMLT